MATANQVNAIDRIGSGPWHDRLGRLFANNNAELLNTRPINANTTIINDIPNEDGVSQSRRIADRQTPPFRITMTF